MVGLSDTGIEKVPQGSDHVHAPTKVLWRAERTASHEAGEDENLREREKSHVEKASELVIR